MRKNGYSAQKFIEAIPGTGGIISEIAKRVGCAWHTARKYVEEYPTINRVWQNERNRITDIAQSNIIGAIIDDKDLQTSKWWLQVMSDDFAETSHIDVTSGGEPLANEETIKRAIEIVNDYQGRRDN